MKKKPITIFILFRYIVLITIVSGCVDKNSSSTNLTDEGEDKLPIYVNMEGIMKKEGVESLSAIASEINYIPLELTDNSILRRVSGAVSLNDNYVVYDGSNICLYNSEGKYIKTVSQLGQAPSDIRVVIFNVVVDHKGNNLYLFTSHKVIKFNENADYVHHFQINDGTSGGFTKGAFTSYNTMILAYDNTTIKESDTTTVYNAIEVDTVGNIINKFVNYSPIYIKDNGARSLIYIPMIDIFKDNVRFMDYSNDTIFTISDNTMIPYYIFDLGNDKTTFTLDLSINDLGNRAKLDEALDKFKGHAINGVMENDNYFFITLTEKGISNNNLIYSTYNKQTKELKRLKNDGLLNDIDGGPAFFPQKCIGDKMIGWKNADEFKEEILSMDYNEQKAKYGERFEKVYQLAKSIKEDDNPILIVVKK